MTDNPGLNDVIDELKKQSSKGRDVNHDQMNYPQGQLLHCAEFCIDTDIPSVENFCNWPYQYKEKIKSYTKERQLAIAASLIIAEINRLKSYGGI